LRLTAIDSQGLTHSTSVHPFEVGVVQPTREHGARGRDRVQIDCQSLRRRIDRADTMSNVGGRIDE
jgi:hypothetical protein